MLVQRNHWVLGAILFGAAGCSDSGALGDDLSLATDSAAVNGERGNDDASEPRVPADGGPCVITVSPPTPAAVELTRQQQVELSWRTVANLIEVSAENSEAVLSTYRGLQNFAVDAPRTANEGNDVVALGILAAMFHSGKGVTQDSRMAFDLYAKVANHNHAAGIYGIARMYLLGHISGDAGTQGNFAPDRLQFHDVVASFDAIRPSHVPYIPIADEDRVRIHALLTAGAVRNHPPRLIAHGVQHINARQFQAGLSLLMRAAGIGTGSRSARAVLGDYLLNAHNHGEGTHDHNIAEGLRDLREAAALNDAHAHLALGIANRDGLGVTKDLRHAYEHFQKAAELEAAGAYNELGSMYELGNVPGVSVDLPLAISYYQRSADGGSPSGLYNFARVFRFGLAGTDIDLPRAFDLYHRARLRAYGPAREALGVEVVRPRKWWEDPDEQRELKALSKEEWIRRELARIQGN